MIIRAGGDIAVNGATRDARELDLLTEVMTSLPAGVVAIDGNGVVQFGNEFIEQFSATDGGGIEGLVFRHGDGRPYRDDERPMMTALRSGVQVVGCELDVLDRSGRTRYLLASAVPLRDEEGAVRLVVAAYFDITLQKNAELRAAAHRDRQDALLQTLRTALLPPHLPRLRGATLAARYHAASHDIGGDFYDVFPLRGQSYGVVVGDVCGQGPQAAVITSLIRHTLRGAAMSTRRPGEALQLVNEALLDADSDRFCTAVFARIRPTGNDLQVCLARAGHPFPMIKRSSGEVRCLPSGGALLGVIDRVDIAEETFALGPGDSLVLVTDGVTEATGAAGAELGWQGVAGILEALPDRVRADDIAEELSEAATRNGASDDVAILVVQQEGTDAATPPT